MSMGNMGKPISFAQRDRAFHVVVNMGIDRVEAFQMVEAVSNKLERDEPYEAMQEACKVIDLTGAYVLLAHLLTDPSGVSTKKKPRTHRVNFNAFHKVRMNNG